MPRRAPAYKETQIFDWDSEPLLERPSAFFHADGGSHARPARRRGGWRLLVACALVIGMGWGTMVLLAPLLHRHWG